jgi:hypothetical protein
VLVLVLVLPPDIVPHSMIADMCAFSFRMDASILWNESNHQSNHQSSSLHWTRGPARIYQMIRPRTRGASRTYILTSLEESKKLELVTAPFNKSAPAKLSILLLTTTILRETYLYLFIYYELFIISATKSCWDDNRNFSAGSTEAQACIHHTTTTDLF